MALARPPPSLGLESPYGQKKEGPRLKKKTEENQKATRILSCLLWSHRNKKIKKKKVCRVRSGGGGAGELRAAPVAPAWGHVRGLRLVSS